MKQLTNRKIPLYALSGFGPNLLMIFVTAYLLDAVIPTGLVADRQFWSITGAVIVSPVIFSILFTVAKVIDGIIDIPLASFTDNIRNKLGKRKTAILLGFFPMVVSFILLWMMPSREEESMLNTVWITVFAIIFFCSYTMCLVAYYASFSEIVPGEKERVKLSSWKSAFDTIGYATAYAVVPLLIGMGLNIQNIVLYFIPLLATMIIPLFMLKETSDQSVAPEPKIPLGTSIALVFKNKLFMKYIVVLVTFYFGLQMFLAGQNVIASGVMELNGWQIAIINTAAFAPVPIMLLLFNHIHKKKGLRFAFQLALILFAISMGIFSIARGDFFPKSWVPRLIIGAIGSTVGSFSIGAFFAVPYIYPSHIAALEIKRTGKNHSAMYFAIQGLFTQIVAAVSVSAVYLNVKSITTPTSEIFGISLVPLIVAITCIVAFILCFRLPSKLEKTE